ncbi:hypothetical protein HDV01_003806 [Terramyces sp. JEL0728]|nr:hypothetical protein HDV01_003806 [Terramyces sp. JEL0728]
MFSVKKYVFVDSYVGESANDDEQKYHGNGTVTFQSGSSYIGQFKGGKMDGEGIYNWNDGIVYRGHFDSDRILGTGEYTWDAETLYKGQLENGLRHGTGVFTVKNKFIDGEWAKGKPDGYSECHYDDQSVYSGSWKSGKKHGNGKMLYQSGNYYVGEWKDDWKCGKGKMSWIDRNEEYEGNWENGVPNGFGQYIWKMSPLRDHQYPLQNMYRGYWVDGKREGYGVFFYSSGAKFEGNWKNNLKEGYGKFISENGRVYEGDFVEDRPIKKVELFNNLMPYLFHIPNDAGTDADNEITLALNKIIFRYSTSLRALYHKCCEKTKQINGFRTKNIIVKSVIWDMLKSTGILSLGFSIAELNRAYAIAFKDEPAFTDKFNDPHNRNTEMIFHDFLEYILLISHHIYKKSSNLSLHESGIIASFSYMIKTHLLPYLAEPPEELREGEHPIVSTWEAACGANESQMENLYNLLHHESKNSLKNATNDKTITYREFILILKDYKIFEIYGNELNVKNVISEFKKQFPGISENGSLNLEFEMVVDEFTSCINKCAKLSAEHIIPKLEYAENNPQEEDPPVQTVVQEQTAPAEPVVPISTPVVPIPPNPSEQKIEAPSSARRRSVMVAKAATTMMTNTVKKRLSKIELPPTAEQEHSARPSTTVKPPEEKPLVKIDRITILN